MKMNAGKLLTTIFIFTASLLGQPNDAAGRIKEFMNEKLVCDSYVFTPGNFPGFRWENEARVENEIGKFPLNVSYYNSEFEKVTQAAKKGRYGAVIEGTAPSGFKIIRYVTLFCSEAEFDDYSPNVPVKITKLPSYGIDDKKWSLYDRNLEHFSFGSLKFFPRNDPDAAIFLAGLNDMDTANTVYDTPRIRDRQWWITMKQKLETIPLPDKAPFPVKQLASRSQVLNEIIENSLFNKSDLSKLSTLCENWSRQGGSGNVTIVVHKGKIIFYECHGNDPEGTPLNKESCIWMASITKLLTGFLMMQYVDHGLISLDDPVNKYLKEIKNSSMKMRNLFTHTTGLDFAGEWASDWNSALENQTAQVIQFAETGKNFSYNRVGYALAGKVIENITGRAVPYLFRENIFLPLGMNSAYSDNTYGGLYCTALDLAKLGMMLLNKGRYGNNELISSDTFDEMLPHKLPGIEKIWGIGTSPFQNNGLSKSAFGHPAASGSIFIIDPGLDLIIVSARNETGKMYDKFRDEFIRLCTSLVKQN